ncbi:MAG: Fe-S cluster assembly protein SufB [Candidatus Yonathbacteria bacterium RIFOXYD1_FULL_52_36]|uniref:Fe-S cluster assembly protein SufB n=1 Tax=Candidatus Yonathbacteria bacterium RIFOXYD1_FULL_52_36 TaxID=1802730 RepID=A0A1G2SP58_9BACT|nr:MAG: Fe-S cluster assembly protein SufB [Candidatus Yonathbacteria bacterium RIFOXYD1_FULL_52_36]
MWKAQKSAKNEGNPGIHTGLSLDLVRHISKIKNEPEWMLEKRIAAYELYMNAPMPKWGPDLSGLDLENMVYFVDPGVAETDRWDELPPEITETFEKLGIPKAEREYLGGVGAQYDSGVVYHRLKQSLADKGVVFENMDVALQKYPELVQKYFMTDCVPAKDHKFTMLHGAVWSGGTFIYVPKGVKVDMPLQAYFRMNREASGQFEHTLIIADEGSEIEYIEGCSAPKYTSSSLHAGCVELFVHQDAKIKYVSIENWSLNTYNLNTKRAIVRENGAIKWVNGNMGSGVTMLYPSSVLIGEGARSDNLGLVIAGKGQIQDTGAKAIHLAPNTSSSIYSKSISKDGGVANYRGLIKTSRRAINTRSSLVCDALLLDSQSAANAFPAVENANDQVEISHEARIGRIGEDEIFYLKSRGLSESEAVRLAVTGFANPIIKELPLEYALELNKLINLEMGDSAV